MNMSNEEIEKIFEDSYYQFKIMFSTQMKNKNALMSFIKFVITTLESNENVSQKILSNSAYCRFNNLNMSEQCLIGTIFAEKKETTKKLMIYFNSLKNLNKNIEEDVISKLIINGKEIQRLLEIA
jgi:hypothetical protein